VSRGRTRRVPEGFPIIDVYARDMVEKEKASGTLRVAPVKVPCRWTQAPGRQASETQKGASKMGVDALSVILLGVLIFALWATTR
jgi:hypothetical protein